MRLQKHGGIFSAVNERRKTILDAQIRAYLAIDERTSEGHRMRRLRPIHAHHNYPISQVLFGQGFMDMMQEEDGDGQSFDFANFNRTYLCPSFEPS